VICFAFARYVSQQLKGVEQPRTRGREAPCLEATNGSRRWDTEKSLLDSMTSPRERIGQKMNVTIDNLAEFLNENRHGFFRGWATDRFVRSGASLRVLRWQFVLRNPV
jgi:hypothetical protein